MRTGLDRLATHTALGAELRALRVGLLAHPASVDRRLVHARTILDALGVRVAVVFGPEHGYGGEAQDMIGVADARDALGTPIRSLYGERFEDLSPLPEELEGLDVVVVDLQDVGSRYYTFVWTAVLVRALLRAAPGCACWCSTVPTRWAATWRASRAGGETRESSAPSSGLEPTPGCVSRALTLGGAVVMARGREGHGGRRRVRVLGVHGARSGGGAAGVGSGPS